MQCDLERIFSSLASYISSNADSSDSYIFDETTFSSLSPKIATDCIYIRKTYHSYNSFRADQLWFHASIQTYRCLGLLILAVVFRPDVPRVTVELKHPESDIKYLVVESVYPTRENLYPGYTTRPYALHYHPKQENSHPWVCEYINPYDLPCFFLTNQTDCIIKEEEWQQRDTVIGFGNDASSVLLAELLLNIGIGFHVNDGTEDILPRYTLEGEGGVRGVGVHSAEASFFILSE